MSVWTAVKTWSAAVVSVADMQTYVSDNTNYLKDQVDAAVKVLTRQVTLQTVTNTVTETAVFTYAVPGGTLGTNKILRLTLNGDFTNNSGGLITVTIRVKYGATTIFSSAMTNVNTGGNSNPLALFCELGAANATNAQRAMTQMFFGATNSGGATGTAPTIDFVGGSGGSLSAGAGAVAAATHESVAEDSTSSQNLVVTFQMGTANASITMHANIVDVTVR